MPRVFLTDEQVEAEIARLKATDEVKIARREKRIQYKRRQQLYLLRCLHKRGAELMNEGVTVDSLDLLEKLSEDETDADGGK